MDTNSGAGIVRLGEVRSTATWQAAEGHLQISFESATLSAKSLRDLSQYQTSSQPMPVQLPGEAKAKNGVLIGFERSEKIATFHLSR
jgi:hypothetical protein